MVSEKTVEHETVHLYDECSFWYAHRQTAESYEAYCSEHKACSLATTRETNYRSD